MTSSNKLRWRAGLVILGLGAVASVFAFTFTVSKNTGLPVKWPAGSINIRLMLGDTPVLSDGSTFNSSTAAAALAWNAVIGSAQLRSTVSTGSPASSNNFNELAFSTSVFGKDFGEGVLAVTTGFSRGNERAEADILFNTSSRTWDSFRGILAGHDGKMDIQRVAIHELGHLLGLDHPDEASQTVSAIMNSRISNLDALAQDDIEGARSLYGPPEIPSNDNFSNARDIILSGSKTISLRGENTKATKEIGEPRHADNSGGRSVWWRWTSPSTGSVTIDTGQVDPVTNKIDLAGGKSSYFDTTLAVYTGASVGSLTTVASDDDIEDGVIQLTSVSFPVSAGTVYRIAVDGYSNADQDPTDQNGADNGGINLNLTFVGDLGTAPSITTQPGNQTVTSGNNASFAVVASGAEPLVYQWLFNSSIIAGATNATLSLTGITAAQAGTYSVTVANSAGTITSSGATLTVNAPTPPPTIPPPSSGGGGGGGGAPSLWFCAALVALGLGRLLRGSRP